jgi:type I restriction enzyme S subunit
MKLTVDPDKADARYLYYYFRLPNTVEAIHSLAISSGVPHINLDILRKFQVIAPPVPVQRRIAAIVSTYDELIQNNKRRIVLLEKLAEEIYREWFVRRRFPGHEKVKIVKGVPENWSIRTIGELCTKVTDGAHASPAFCAGGKPMASVKDMHANGFALETIKTISDKDFEMLKKTDCQPLKNDVLIAKDGSYLKHVFVWDHDYELVILSSIAILRPNLKRILPYFLAQVLKQDSIKAMMSGYVSGSALPRIILKDFKKMRLLVPHFDLILLFEGVAAPIYRSIHLANRQNDQLQLQRDNLLPRLISGKLPVENLDIQFPPGMAEELNAEATATAHA